MSNRFNIAAQLVELGIQLSEEELALFEESGPEKWEMLEQRPWSGGEEALLALSRSIEQGALAAVPRLDEERFSLLISALEALRRGEDLRLDDGPLWRPA